MNVRSLKLLILYGGDFGERVIRNFVNNFEFCKSCDLLAPRSSRAQSQAHDLHRVVRLKYNRHTYRLKNHGLKNPRCTGFALPGVVASASISAEEGRFYKYPEEKEVRRRCCS
uniref:Uncharacterized protein n=1 Tax=Candidatus Methanogaster sp. ANME-2c ERB4 TaxID=2759911 RepID=A0A7G9YPX3_9EURY|nr:hypothetical protein NEPELPOK_00008 [Methanosarcinales archaeon ANME-2c ERB4]